MLILVESLGNCFPFSYTTFKSVAVVLFWVKRIFSRIFYLFKYDFSPMFSTVLWTQYIHLASFLLHITENVSQTYMFYKLFITHFLTQL